jgi:hypothetical protein
MQGNKHSWHARYSKEQYAENMSGTNDQQQGVEASKTTTGSNLH